MKTHRITRSALSAALLLAVSHSSVNAQTARTKPLIERYAHKDVKPRDGWDDDWQKKHSAHTADKTADPDGDGISNWEEMLDGTDPSKANKKGEIFISAAELQKQAEDAARAQQKKAQEWPQKQAELAATTRQTFDGKGADPEFVRHDNAEQKQAVAQRLAEAVARAPAVEKSLDDIAAKHGLPRSGTAPGGKGWTLVGESPAGPLLMSTQNARSSNTTNADDLWPAGLHSWQNTALTRNLTGSGVTTAIFEAGSAPGILTGHNEFQGRALQVDTVTAGNHATAVADVIAGGGVLDVYRNSVNQGKMLRGVAYQSNVRGHSLAFFNSNILASVSGGQRFSNHSYGLSGGWSIITFDNITYYWFWQNNAFAEEPRFGLYSAPANPANGISSSELDSFVYSNLVQLPVYAAGNPNNYGPGSSPSPFHVVLIGNTYYSSTATRDWINGDDGYDTVLSPATAKNVLSVGSILDITSSTVYLSGFSGTGPTDDGRIKPDVVAVGQRNTSLGQGSSLFLAHSGSSTAYYDGVNADSEGTINQAGTSFAAPQVQGALALAQQRRAQLLPSAGPLLASTWRALSIHTAQELGSPGPDYLYGWGVFDAVALVKTVEDDSTVGRGALIKEFEIAQGQPKSFLVSLPANTAGRLTLAWSDPAGNPPPTDSVLDDQAAMLVNDINLSIQDTATGATTNPWILNPDLTGESAAARSAAATTGVDSRNNVERIDITSTSQARTFKVTISPQGAITSGPQKVSLIITGAAPVPPAPVSFAFSGNPNNASEMAFSLSTDPGAYFTVQTSTELMNGSWTDVSSSTVLAAGTQTTVLVNQTPSETRRFWRLRRGQ